MQAVKLSSYLIVAIPIVSPLPLHRPMCCHWYRRGSLAVVERIIEEGNRVTARMLIWVAMHRGIRKVRRVPVELRRARVPVRYKVTRNASGQDGRLDPVVVHREVYHAVVIAGVAIELNLGDVRGGQSQVRAGPDVREPLRRRGRSRALHQTWVGVRLVIVRRHQEPAVKVLDQHPLVDGTKWRRRWRCWRRRRRRRQAKGFGATVAIARRARRSRERRQRVRTAAA
mmetsp:Transcript_13171/g.53158  ORF Transcript_13171/g.53158 Transcript_13171/m.53158 type:complete len:227 (+) Transcript_13171:108-788(+)